MIQVLLFYALSQVHRQGDLGDEVDGIKGDAVKFLGDDDGCRMRRCALWSSRKTVLCIHLLMVLGLAADGNDGGDCVKSSSDAGVRTMFDPLFASVTCLAVLFPVMPLSSLSLSFGCVVCLRHSAWLFTYFGCPSMSPKVRLVYLFLVQYHATFAFFRRTGDSTGGRATVACGQEWLAL